MLEHEKKLQENIIEYVLYLYHTEDLLRSLSLNKELVEEMLIDKQGIKGRDRGKLMRWYEEMLHEMESQNLAEKGHVEEVYQVIGELSYVHNALMTTLNDKDYQKLFGEAYPGIVELKKKSDNSVENPIELCFNGIYGVMVLRMKKKKITDETLEEVKKFSNLLTYLGKRYQDVREGKMVLPKPQQN